MSPWSQPRGWRLWLVASVLFAGGFLNDPPWKFYPPDQPLTPNAEAQHVVVNLLREGSFANPFSVARTGPTAHVAPGYPWLVLALLRVFGDGAAGVVAIRVLATGALSLQFALLPWAARVFGYSAWTGVLAALFGILVKPGREEMWETHVAGLATMLLAVGMCTWRGTAPYGRGSANGDLHGSNLVSTAPLAEPRPQEAVPQPSALRAAVLALAAGLVFLLQPVIAAVYVAWAATRPAHRWLLLTIPLLVCAPWIVRNSIATGGPSFIRDDLGLELYVSFNDCAPYGIRTSERQGCVTALHPNASPGEAAAVASLGEYRYNQSRLRIALAWIAGHPLHAVRLIAQRAWFFWFPSDDGFEGYLAQRKRFLALHALTLLSFAGLWASWRRLASTHVLALWLVVYPLIYYLVEFEERYRYPILWITFLLAAAAIPAVLRPRSRLQVLARPPG